MAVQIEIEWVEFSSDIKKGADSYPLVHNMMFQFCQKID